MKKTNEQLVMKFEGLNDDYINGQIEGVIMEITKKENTGFMDENYIDEKIRNSISQFELAMKNFGNRVKKFQECRKEFLALVQENKKEE